MKKIFIYRVLFLIIISFACFNISNAQETGKDEKEMHKRWDRIEELKRLKMLEELNLSEEESAKFLTKYVNFRKQMKEIEKERSGLLNDLDGLMKSSAKEPDLLKKIEEIESIDQKMFNNRKGFIQGLRSIISIEKSAKYILFERNFQRELQSILRDAQKGAFRPGKTH
jgi:hypothetical protein